MFTTAFIGNHTQLLNVRRLPKEGRVYVACFGTTEAKLAEYLSTTAKRYDTAYGEVLSPKGDNIHNNRSMDEAAMTALFQRSACPVVDATHPRAAGDGHIIGAARCKRVLFAPAA